MNQNIALSKDIYCPRYLVHLHSSDEAHKSLRYVIIIIFNYKAHFLGQFSEWLSDQITAMFAARTGVIFHSWYTEEYLKQCYFDLTSGCGIVCNVLCTGHGRAPHLYCTGSNQRLGWIWYWVGRSSGGSTCLCWASFVIKQSHNE